MLAEMYVKIRLSEEESSLRAQKLHATDVDASKRLSLQVRKPHGRTVCNLKTKFEMLRRIGELFRSMANCTSRQPQLGDIIFSNLIARNAPSPTCPTDLNKKNLTMEKFQPAIHRRKTNKVAMKQIRWSSFASSHTVAESCVSNACVQGRRLSKLLISGCTVYYNCLLPS